MPLFFIILLFSCSPPKNKFIFIQNTEEYLKSINFNEEKENYSLNFIEIKIKKNQGLFEILINLKVNSYDALSLINILHYNIDLKKIKPSQIIRLKFNKFNQVVSFQYQENITLTHEIIRNPLGILKYYKKQLPLIKNYQFIVGVFKKGSSLNNELLQQNIPKSLIATVNKIVSSTIKVRSNTRPNDIYKILIENFWYNDHWIKGRILYIYYKGLKIKKKEFFRYFDYDEESSYNSYYTLKGLSLFTKNLRFPVNKFRISSHYTMRIHPITGVKKKHNGIDYVSPFNSNVYTISSGKVIISTYNKLSGNYIAIKHSNNTVSYYLHLNQRFKKKGSIVKNNEIIGTVGKTGLVTGVHLHFGLKNNKGKWINPESKRMIATPKLKNHRLKQFKKQIKTIYKIIEVFNIEKKI